MISDIRRAPRAALLCAALAAAGPRPALGQLPGAVRVEILEAGSGRPLPAAEVTSLQDRVAGLTGAEGRAVLRGLAPGTHTLRASHPGHADASADVVVENGRTAVLVLSLVPRPVALRGLVVEAEALPPGATVLRPGLDAPHARDVADLVDGAPGVTVVRRGGPGSPATPTIRGSAGDQVLVLVDGVAVNSPLSGEADLSLLSLEGVRRVVVVPGVEAARFGPGALAGAILVETRAATRSSLSATVDAGSLGSAGLDAEAAVAGADGRWALSAGGGWRRTTGAFAYPVPDVRGGGTARRANADARTLSAFAEAAWTSAGATAVRLRVHGDETRRGAPGPVTQPSPESRAEQRALGAVLQASAGGATRGWRASLAADERRAAFVDPAPPFGTPYDARSRVRQVEARGELRRPVGVLAATAGADARLRRVRADALDGDGPARVDGGGAWADLAWSVGERGRRWLRAGGTLRLDVHTLLDGPVLSPAVSVAGGDGPTSLSASWGHAVAPPGLSDLYFQEGVLARANPDLEPERVRHEVVVEAARRLGSAGDRGRLEVSAFRADVDGMILWFPDHRFVWSPTNVDVRRRGVEAAADLRLGPLAPLSAAVTWTDVAYADGTLDGPVVYRPRLEARVAARTVTGPLAWSAAWRHTGSRRTRPGSALNTLPGHARLDAGVAAAFDAGPVRTSLDLAVDNVLDTHAALLVDYPLPGRTWSLRLRVAPPAP